jgi:hypothetical protein
MNSKEYKMNEDMLWEQYCEEMYERRANGLDKQNFATWKANKEYINEVLRRMVADQGPHL